MDRLSRRLWLLAVGCCCVSLCAGCWVGEPGSVYTGTWFVTWKGKTCQRWDSQSPHTHSYTDPTNFPDATLAEAANYCRDPDNAGDLWCYTTDPKKLWDWCEVPSCSATTSALEASEPEMTTREEQPTSPVAKTLATTTPEKTKPEKTATEQTATKQTTPEQTTSEKTTPEQTPTKQTTPEQTTPKQPTSEQTTSEQTTSKQTTSEQTTPKQTTSEQTTLEQITPEETTPEQTTPEKTTNEQTATGETTSNRTTPEHTTKPNPTQAQTTLEQTTLEPVTPKQATSVPTTPVQTAVKTAASTEQEASDSPEATSLSFRSTARLQNTAARSTQMLKDPKYVNGCNRFRMQQPVEPRGDLIMDVVIVDLGACVRKCQTSGPCGSFYFHAVNSTCILHHTVAPAFLPLPEHGWRFYA